MTSNGIERTITETVSFSLTMGTTPIESSFLSVFTAFKYLVRLKFIQISWQIRLGKKLTSEMSPLVNNTWAIGCSSCPNKLSHSAIRRPCPIAARAFLGIDLSRHNELNRGLKTNLFSDQIPWSRIQIHSSQTNTNCPRTDKDDIVSTFFEFYHCFDNRREYRNEGLMSRFVHDGRSSCLKSLYQVHHNENAK
jgi:hypothetical protein